MIKLRQYPLPKRNKKFYSTLYRLRQELWAKNIALPLPSMLIIEPTNACNLSCPACPTGAGTLNRPKRMMSFLEFKGIVNQAIGYVNRIALFNYGEPFLNKELLRMVKYATSKGIHIKVSTNGEFFKSKEFCLRVVRSGLQHLVICLDGADQETLSKYRRGANFSGIMNGFKFICEAKKKLKSETPRVELQFIVMKHNEHQRVYMEQLAHRLGVNVYSEKTVNIYTDNPKIRELLPEDPSLSRYYLKRNKAVTLKGKMHNGCRQIYTSTVINSNGTVVPCCYDLDSKYVMGNVFKESLKSIWRNKKYQTFRRKIMTDKKSIAMCNMCPEDRYPIVKKINLSK